MLENASSSSNRMLRTGARTHCQVKLIAFVSTALRGRVSGGGVEGRKCNEEVKGRDKEIRKSDREKGAHIFGSGL